MKTWQYIATKGIVNAPARESIEATFTLAGSSCDEAGTLELWPNSKGFARCDTGSPFFRGIQGLLRQYEKEIGNAKIKKVIFILRGLGPATPYNLDNNLVLHMLVELCRPGENDINGEASSALW
jgi:hypothetical protein